MTISRAKQDQIVGEHGLAIQSNGDVNINSGLSVSDVRQIIEIISDQLPRLASEATKIFEDRLKTFEKEILLRFENDKTTDINAFADPDFQFLLANAQRTFGRSGSEQVIENLVDLIAERSKNENQSRLALTINNAVDRVSQLTPQEFSELSLVFLLRHVVFTSAKTPSDVREILRTYAIPLAGAIDEDRHSYSYLESLGCGKLSVGSSSLPSILLQVYPKVFVTGFLMSDLAENTKIPVHQLIDAGLLRLEPSSGTVITEIENLGDLLSSAQIAGIEASELRDVWQTSFLGVPMDEARVIHSMRGAVADQSDYPEWYKGFVHDIDALHHLWERSPIKYFDLTSVGIAIGFR
jgi:hypothetical protein